MEAMVRVSVSRLGVPAWLLLVWWDLGQIHGQLSAIFGLVGNMMRTLSLFGGGKCRGTD